MKTIAKQKKILIAIFAVILITITFMAANGQPKSAKAALFADNYGAVKTVWSGGNATKVWSFAKGVYNGQEIAIAGTSGSKILRSTDGETWNTVADSKVGGTYRVFVAYGDGVFVALAAEHVASSGGNYKYFGSVSFDGGVTWKAQTFYDGPTMGTYHPYGNLYWIPDATATGDAAKGCFLFGTDGLAHRGVINHTNQTVSFAPFLPFELPGGKVWGRAMAKNLVVTPEYTFYRMDFPRTNPDGAIAEVPTYRVFYAKNAGMATRTYFAESSEHYINTPNPGFATTYTAGGGYDGKNVYIGTYSADNGTRPTTIFSAPLAGDAFKSSASWTVKVEPAAVAKDDGFTAFLGDRGNLFTSIYGSNATGWMNTVRMYTDFESNIYVDLTASGQPFNAHMGGRQVADMMEFKGKLFFCGGIQGGRGVQDNGFIIRVVKKSLFEYKLNGGEGVAPVQAAVDKTVTPSITLAAAPTRPGYSFIGWSDGKNTYPAASSYTVTETDITFTAQWEETKPLIKTFDVADNKLTVEVESDSTAKQYQFWIKQKVNTDQSGNDNSAQFIWQLMDRVEFDASKKAELTVGDGSDYLFNGNYEVILRVKEGGTIIGSYYYSYTPGAAGQARISTLSVNNLSNETLYAVDKTEGTLKITALGNGADNIEYTLFKGSQSLATNGTGVFSLDISGYDTGRYTFTVTAQNGGGSDAKNINVYIFGDYDASEMPVIKSLETGTGAAAEFVMRLSYDSGDNITLSDAQSLFDITLMTDGVILYPKTEGGYAIGTDGVLEVTFEHTYAKTGIYLVEGRVSRKGVSGVDDYIVKYYHGFKRDANVLQTPDKTSVAAGNSITITASGGISGAADNILYSFLREDASGWVTIKGYSQDDTLTWTPAKAGVYRILLRIKGENSGSYEAEHSAEYTVTGGGLAGSAAIAVTDYQTGTAATVFEAGKPYCISISYTGDEKVLYMFTVYNETWGLKYINIYSPAESIMFTPSKSGTFIITARVINVNSFGYKDIAEPLTIVA